MTVDEIKQLMKENVPTPEDSLVDLGSFGMSVKLTKGESFQNVMRRILELTFTIVDDRKICRVFPVIDSLGFDGDTISLTYYWNSNIDRFGDEHTLVRL